MCRVPGWTGVTDPLRTPLRLSILVVQARTPGLSDGSSTTLVVLCGRPQTASGRWDVYLDFRTRRH